MTIWRHRQHELIDYPRRVQAVRILRSNEALLVEVGQDVGIGGLLLNAATALNAGRQESCRVRLRFTSRTYMPSWHPDDWLESYFTRFNHIDVGNVVIQSRHLPGRYVPRFAEWGNLVWSTLSIRPEIRAMASTYMQGAYAAVHYRGSDKFLETRRVDFDRVLTRVSDEMNRRQLHRLFVASDEPEFVRAALTRFGSMTISSLPLEATAKNGIPPHFSDLPGETKAREALATMLALSGARVCVRTESYLSAWAQTLAAPDAKFIVVS